MFQAILKLKAKNTTQKLCLLEIHELPVLFLLEEKRGIAQTIRIVYPFPDFSFEIPREMSNRIQKDDLKPYFRLTMALTKAFLELYSTIENARKRNIKEIKEVLTQAIILHLFIKNFFILDDLISIVVIKDKFISAAMKFKELINSGNALLDTDDFIDIFDEYIIRFKSYFIEENENIRNKILEWYCAFKTDPEFENVTLKMTGSLSNFHGPAVKMNKVSEEDFLRQTEDELPFFVGTQFGIRPRIEDAMYKKLERQKIAVLSKSGLSGHVHGLLIYLVKKGELIQYKEYLNDKPLDKKE